MAKKFNYRAFYEQQTGKQIPEDFDVHHLDFDRENNAIENLVAIPRKLHKEFHMRNHLFSSILDYFLEENFLINGKGTHIFRFGDKTYEQKINELLKYKRCCDHIIEWCSFRDTLINKDFYSLRNPFSY